MYVVAGTQAERAHANHLIIMKMENLHRNKIEKEEEEDEEEGDDEDSDEDDDKKAELNTAMIKHTGSINRIRVSSY